MFALVTPSQDYDRSNPATKDVANARFDELLHAAKEAEKVTLSKSRKDLSTIPENARGEYGGNEERSGRLSSRGGNRSRRGNASRNGTNLDEESI